MAPPTPSVASTIRHKKLLYGRYVDTKQFSRMHELALPSARFAFLNSDGTPITVGRKAQVFESLDAYCSTIGKAVAKAQTFHLFGHGELEQTGPDEVQAVFSMEDTFVLNGSLGLIYSRGGGHYHEVWRKEGEDWFLADLRLERLCVIESFCFVLVFYLVKFAALCGVDLTP